MITTTKTVAKYTVTDGVLDYSVPFPLYEAGDVLVLWSAAGGKESALALTNDYSVEIFSDGSGGTVTLLAGRVPAGATLALVSNIPETQELDLSHTAEVDTESLERELDRQVQMIQQHRSELDLCIKLNVTDNRTPEEVADELFEARDRAETAAKKAASSEDEAGKQAARAEDEADRAKAEADRAAQAAVLGVGAENLDAVWKLDAEIPAGGTLELPLFYFAGRNMLHLSYDGVELYRGPQYEETGERDELSSSVKMLIPLSRGTVMHAWAVASNVARNVEAAEEQAKAEADRARQEADRAESEADRARAIVQAAVVDAVGQAQAQADRAEAEADRAEKEADRAETARNVAQNAAQEATEQADRADDAAMDAGRYRNEAQEAAKCAAASIRSRSIAAVQSADLLDRVPSGFFVINTDIVLPGTIQQPLTPVDSVEDIPNMDGFFLLVPPFENDCPSQPEEPEPPEKPDVPDWTLPCGRRVKI